MEHVRSSARLLQSQHACDAIIIDYLQLCDMTTGQNNRNREQEVAQATRKAKLLAKELNVPVVLLSQLNPRIGKPPRRPPRTGTSPRKWRNRAGCGRRDITLPPRPRTNNNRPRKRLPYRRTRHSNHSQTTQRRDGKRILQA